ncbi:hypothetical protein BGW39_011581 [Mortierella sp. 14UC]|nr:hypothetical protein BGW39_011581 [Mortierella sp. 14UC]
MLIQHTANSQTHNATNNRNKNKNNTPTIQGAETDMSAKLMSSLTSFVSKMRIAGSASSGVKDLVEGTNTPNTPTVHGVHGNSSETTMSALASLVSEMRITGFGDSGAGERRLGEGTDASNMPTFHVAEDDSSVTLMSALDFMVSEMYITSPGGSGGHRGGFAEEDDKDIEFMAKTKLMRASFNSVISKSKEALGINKSLKQRMQQLHLPFDSMSLLNTVLTKIIRDYTTVLNNMAAAVRAEVNNRQAASGTIHAVGLLLDQFLQDSKLARTRAWNNGSKDKDL